MAARRFPLINQGTILRAAKAATITGAWSFAPTADEKLRITDAEADGQAAVMFIGFWDQDSRQGVVGFGSSGDEKFRIRSDSATAGIYLLPGDGILDLDGVIRMQQRGNALADVNDYGQWWVKNDTPTVPRFTDDAGFDGILAQLNVTQTVSGAWTHSGVTTFTADIVAGTIDADFDALTATSFGGVATANLLSRIAAETITAAWKFETEAGGKILTLQDGAGTGTAAVAWMEFQDELTSRMGFVGYGSGSNGNLFINNDVHGANVLIQAENEAGTNIVLAEFDPDAVGLKLTDDTKLILGASNDATLQWASGGVLELNFATANKDFQILEDGDAPFHLDFANHIFNIRDGYVLRVRNSADADWMDMSHDGTNFNFAGTNTVDITWAGYTAINWLEAKTHWFGGGGSRGGFQAESISIADDATAVFDRPFYSVILIVTNFNHTATGMAAISGTSTPTVMHETSAISFGSPNPNVDGDLNVWPDTTTSLSIKNRLGSTRNVTVFTWGI